MKKKEKARRFDMLSEMFNIDEPRVLLYGFESRPEELEACLRVAELKLSALLFGNEQQADIVCAFKNRRALLIGLETLVAEIEEGNASL